MCNRSVQLNESLSHVMYRASSEGSFYLFSPVCFKLIELFLTLMSFSLLRVILGLSENPV